MDAAQLTTILHDIWQAILFVWVESAPYMLLGLAVAGGLKAFLPEDLVARQLGSHSLWSVVKAAVIGAPLPL